METHTEEEHTAKAAEHSIGTEHACSGELHLPSGEDLSASRGSLSSLELPSLLPHSPKLLLYPPSSCYVCVTNALCPMCTRDRCPYCSEETQPPTAPDGWMQEASESRLLQIEQIAHCRLCNSCPRAVERVDGSQCL